MDSLTYKVTVRIPMKATWVADLWLTAEQMNDIVGHINDDPDAAELIQQNGAMEDDQLLFLEAQVDA